MNETRKRNGTEQTGNGTQGDVVYVKNTGLSPRVFSHYHQERKTYERRLGDERGRPCHAAEKSSSPQTVDQQNAVTAVYVKNTGLSPRVFSHYDKNANEIVVPGATKHEHSSLRQERCQRGRTLSHYENVKEFVLERWSNET